MPGGWSIAGEATFYLAVPFLYRRTRSLMAAVILLVVSSCLAAAAYAPAVAFLTRRYPADWGSLITFFVGNSFSLQFPAVAVGIVLHFALPPFGPAGDSPATVPVPASGGRWAAAAVAVAMLLMVAAPPILSSLALGAAAWAVAVRPVPAVVNPAVRFVGRISYSLYLWHFVVLDHVGF